MMIEKNKDRVISLVKGMPVTPSTEAMQPTTSEVSSSASTSSGEQVTSVIENIAVPGQSDIDPITSLASDSAYLEEEQIGKAMTELNKLRTELHKEEEELSKVISELETKLVNLRNVVHVKKIMHDHLKQQLRVTRQEWAEAYDEYGRISEQKKAELAKRSTQIEDLRERIDKLGKTIRQRVNDLNLKKMTE